MNSSQRATVMDQVATPDRSVIRSEKATVSQEKSRGTRRDYKLKYYPESRFGGYSDIDQLVVFYTRVRSLLEPSFTVLDIGCGRGKHAERRTPRTDLKILKEKCRKVIGVDIDPDAQRNPFVDEFHLIAIDSAWPLPDSTVDLAVCDYVLEHVENPDLFFAECRRVLKPGGYLCLRTTNALSYFGIAARLVPERFHSAIIQRAYVNPRKEEDIFPKRFRCNTVFAIRKALDRHGFEHSVYGYQSDPAHLAFSRVSYFLGVMFQRFAPRSLRAGIFVFARRR